MGRQPEHFRQNSPDGAIAPSGLFAQSNAQQRKPDGAGDPQLQAADFCRTIRLKIRLNTIFGQEKIPQSLAALRDFDGGRYRTRTCDPLHVNAKFKFFLTFFIDLQPYPLQTACFPALFKHRVSGCSAALCGRLCGQTVGAIGLAIWRLTQMWSNCGLPFLPQKLTVPLFYMLSQGCF